MSTWASTLILLALIQEVTHLVLVNKLIPKSRIPFHEPPAVQAGTK